jgi:uncharacterized protein involved in outer membrane biogenesis
MVQAQRVRRRRRLVIALGIYTVLGFVIAPVIIKWQLRRQLPALTHRPVTVQQVRVNPYALSLTVRGLAVTETNGTPFAGFDELYVNFQLSSLFRWTWTFSEIRLTGPTANVVRFADGQFNFADLLTNSAPPSASSPPPPVLIQNLSITNALLTFTDGTTPKPFHTVYGPTHIELKNLSTRPNQHGPYSIMAHTGEGESFTWSGTVSVRPLQSEGQFKLLGIPPAKYGPYLAFFTTARITRGTLDISANYVFNAASFPPQVEVSNAAVQLRDFQLQAPDKDETLLAVADLLVQNVSANLTGATVRVPLVKLRDGSAFVRRDAQGHFEAEKYVFPPTNSFVLLRQFASNLHTMVTADLQASLDELSVENFNMMAEDLSLSTMAELGLDNLALSVKGLSNRTNAPLSTAVSFNWRGGGRVQIESHGTLLPLVAQANVTVSNLALAPLQPYVEQQANLVVHAGELSVDGTAQFDPHDTNTALLQFTGNVALTNFLSSDRISHHEFARWENLGVRGIRLELEPNRLAVDEVKFTGLRASLVVSSNGQLNVLALRKQSPTAAESANPQPVVASESTNAPAAEGGWFPLKLGTLVVERGSFGAADQSLASPFSTRIEEFNGSIRDITFPGLTRATIDLRGKVSALAPFAVTGTLTPDLTNPFVDLKITFTNTDLTPLTPYSEKFAGYPLNKGKLTFDVHYLIENRAVKGENVVEIDQLTFGARNQSTNATKLPVKLGVALLKDRNGRIDLDLPVSGSLDDPNFRIGGLVWKAVINILVKAATSPFALLGALAGGGEELQYVDFDPGLATLNDSQTNKLAKLTKALYERPALNLEIGATYDATKDVEALGRQKVLEKMKVLRIQEVVARGKPAPAMEDLKLEDDEYNRLLRKAYLAVFNTTPEKALRDALAAVIATNAPGSGLSPTTLAEARNESQKGAVALSQRGLSLSELDRQTRRGPATSASTGPAKPKTERELVREELERRLMTTVPVTDEDLHALLQRRTEVVQQFLIGAGNISADRLFPVVPKPGEAGKGGSRVVFSLN